MAVPTMIAAPDDACDTVFAVFDGSKFVKWTREPLAATVFPTPRIAKLATETAARKSGVVLMAIVNTPDHTQPVNHLRMN